MTQIMFADPRPVQRRGMKIENGFSRREAMRTLVMFAAGSTLLACKKELTCTDTIGLAPDDIAIRKSLEYVDRTAIPSKDCLNCQLFKPAAPDSCGGCTVIKGPINPKGYCKSWAQKPA